MTNIDQLPTNIGDSLTLFTATNSDWRWALQFQWSADTTLAGQPMDITGISFGAQLRSTVSDNGVLLNLSTTNGLLIVDGPLGQLQFAVPRDRPTVAPFDHMSNLPSGTAVLDIIAMADGKIINLGQTGPVTVTIIVGVTRLS